MTDSHEVEAVGNLSSISSTVHVDNKQLNRDDSIASSMNSLNSLNSEPNLMPKPTNEETVPTVQTTTPKVVSTVPITQKRRPWRKGKWTDEEDMYTRKLIEAFYGGYLNITTGTTLRSFLAERLYWCDDLIDLELS